MAIHRSSKTHSKKPKKNISQILPLILIGVGLIVLAGAVLALLPKSGESAGNVSGEFPSVVPAAVDYPAPELSLTDLQGNPVSLSSFEGRVVLVNNWAIWCPPCKAEMPVLQAYYDAHHVGGFTIIGIEAGEPTHEVALFVEEYGLTFPVWPDPAMSALEAFRNGSLPSSYVIDRSGQVRLAWTGAISRAMLEKYVTPILEE